MGRTFSWGSLLVGAVLSTVALGCSDDSGGGNGQASRSTFLDQAATQIAADGLSDKPSSSFVQVRGTMERQVSKPNTEYARAYTLARGGPALAGDVGFARVRGEAARALGATLDPAREADGASAQRGIDALLVEVKKRVPAATSCADLGDRALDCVIALLVIEVQRSEVPPGSDAGVTDAGSDAAVDSGLPLPTVTPIECGARDLVGAREIMTTSLSTPETWSGKVLVKRQLLVTSTLTIMPGTEIFMDVDSSIEIGWSNAAAAIIADGTAQAPIRFCGTTADKGFWRTISIGSNVTSNSVLRNVLIADAAGDRAALELDADITIDNVQVRNAELDGVLARDFAPNSRLLSVFGAGRTPIVFLTAPAVERFPRGGTFQNNGDPVLRLRFTTMDATTTFRNVGLPYLQEMDLYQSAGDFIVEAGVEYRLAVSSSLELGWSNGSASVHLNGTPTAPVRFRGTADNAQWGGISIGSNVTTDSVFTNVELFQAGVGQPALSLSAPIKLDGVTLTKSATGMKVGAVGFASGSKNLTITQTTGRPLSAHVDAVFSLPTGGIFTGNTVDEIELTSTNLSKSGTIPDLGVPYFVAGDLYLGDANIVIAPGTDFTMGTDSSIQAAWSNGMTGFVAEGTQAAPIRFIAADPSPGSWEGIVLGRSVLSSSKLSWVEIGYAGGPRTSPKAALDLQRQIPVTNCRFFGSAGYGLKPASGDTTDYTTSNRFENNALGNVQTTAAN